MENFFAQITNPLESGTIPELILYILDKLLPIVLGLAVVAIMYGGFKIAASRGNETKYSEGKKAVGYAVVGILIVVAARAIVEGFLTSFGLQ